MRALTLTSMGLVLITALSGCSDSCESVKADIEGIGREIRSNPDTALDRADELDALRRRLEEMGC